MGVKYTRNLGTIHQKYINKGKKAINLGLEELKTEIDINTPEDTKTLLKNNDILEAKVIGSKIIGKIENKTKYGSYVEFGVGGRQFNYHKPKGTIFYKGVGARMFTKGFDNSEKEILNIFKRVLKYNK